MFSLLNIFFVGVIVWATWHAVKRHELPKNETIIEILACIALVVSFGYMFDSSNLGLVRFSNASYNAGWVFAVIGWIVGHYEEKHHLKHYNDYHNPDKNN